MSQTNQVATVKAAILNVREKASATSTIMTQVFEGSQFNVQSSTDEWVCILLEDGKTGFVMAEHVELAE